MLYCHVPVELLGRDRKHRRVQQPSLSVLHLTSCQSTINNNCIENTSIISLDFQNDNWMISMKMKMLKLRAVLQESDPSAPTPSRLRYRQSFAAVNK
jgi:hypothetical protein